ncbi:MAG: HAD family hydrolase [Coriobacteriia bacterium]
MSNLRKGGLLVLGGVLFDLDGTLLDIPLDAFLREYFALLGPVVAEVFGEGVDERAGIALVLQATEAMMKPHPGRTNEEAFNDYLIEQTGVNLADEAHAQALHSFYEDTFPALQGTKTPRRGAREAVEKAFSLGLKVAIATNPIFPRAAILERMRWAGLSGLPIDVVTSYENMHATKPQAHYFLETAQMLGIEAERCLMVGDDRALDMPAADTGMRTFYVGEPPSPQATWTGDLCDLVDVLPRLVES